MSAGKDINLIKMVGFTVCGVIGLDTFALPAAMGASSIGLWIITAILFFIPYCLITAQLGSAYPEDGGLYKWIERAFGKKNASVAGWYYWVNVAFWMPAVFIAFSEWASYLIPTISEYQILSGAIAVAMCWVIVFIGIKGKDLSVTVTNIAAIAKVGMLITMGGLGLMYGTQYGFTTPLNGIFDIDWGDFGTIVFVSAVIYSLLGFELISSIASEIDNPEKNIPLMTIIAGLLIPGLYIFATLGLLAALNTADPDFANWGYLYAFPEALTILTEGLPGFIFPILMVITLFTLVSNMISWALGGVEILDQVDFAKHNRLLGAKGKYGTPTGSYVMMGLISSLLIIINFALGGANDAFWTILSFSFVIYLLPYLWMFASAIKLKLVDGDSAGYNIPGGLITTVIFSIIGIIFISASVILLFIDDGVWDPLYHLTLIIGTIITTAISLIFMYIDKKIYS